MCVGHVCEPRMFVQLAYKDFRHALKMYGCPIPEKDFPSVARIYDPAATGRINYRKFNTHVARFLQPFGGSMVVSADLGRSGPNAKRADAARGESLLPPQRAVHT